MKHLKIIGLAVIAAAAYMAFAGSASAAPTLTSPEGKDYTGTIDATATPGNSLLLKASFANVTCTESTVMGDVTTNNETHATGPITDLWFGKGGVKGTCGTNHVTPLKNGSGNYGTLTINQKTEVFGSNSAVTIKETTFGFHCVYGTTTNTKLGTFNQSVGSGSASMTISAELPYDERSESSKFACGAIGTWSGSYTVTTPVPLYSN